MHQKHPPAKMAVLVETEGVGSAASKRFALANVASVAIKMEMFFMGESELWRSA